MGGGTWSTTDWTSYSTTRGYDTAKPVDVINTSGVENDFLPKNFKNGIRESRDSADNPRSTAIIVAGDTTGSMGEYAGRLITKGLAAFATLVHERKPVSDPHIMGMAFDDVKVTGPYSRIPALQATQFEADLRIIQQFEKLYITRGGGGNNTESYDLAWLSAALQTSIDCFEKRGEKGILFTYGDEEAPQGVTRDEAERALGVTLESDLSAEQILAMVRRTYDVFHLVVEQGSYARGAKDRVYSSWQALLGQNVIPVENADNFAEIMVSTLEIARAGRDKEVVVGSFSGGTALVVKKAVSGLPTRPNAPGTGLVAL
jgi:hypothetical protein